MILAKNRYSLPAELPLSWSALMQALSPNDTTTPNPALRLVGNDDTTNSKEN